MTLIASLVHLALLILLLPALLGVAYLGLLTLLSARPRPVPDATTPWRFTVLVPAHNEEPGIAATVHSLRRIHWPAEQWQLIVIADNCSDYTAEHARAAGAEVWERFDTQARGKGHALQFALQRILASGDCDAVVVVDADTQVSPNLLSSCAARLDQGAEAVQVYHGVANPDQNWRTQLLAIAYGAFHAVRSRGRERLGVSAGLRGNGMCWRTDMLHRVPFQLNSLAEDLEYGAILGLHGVRVHYVDEAHADALMVTQAQAAAGQRHRWEAGRWAVCRQYAPQLLRHAWKQRDPVTLELALELLTLPLAQLVANLLLVMLLSLIVSFWLPSALAWLWLALLLLAILSLHVLRGWQLSGAGLRALLALARAPFYLAWKLLALLRERGTKEWRRTTREQSQVAEPPASLTPAARIATPSSTASPAREESHERPASSDPIMDDLSKPGHPESEQK